MKDQEPGLQERILTVPTTDTTPNEDIGERPESESRRLAQPFFVYVFDMGGCWMEMRHDQALMASHKAFKFATPKDVNGERELLYLLQTKPTFIECISQ